MPVTLPDNYRRVLSSLAELIEQKVTDLLYLLNDPVEGKIHSVERTFTEKERKEKICLLEKLQRQNRKFFDELDLKPVRYSEDQVFHSDISWLWTIIHDSRTKRMKGYGKLDPDTSSEIDDRISALLDIISEIEQDHTNST